MPHFMMPRRTLVFCIVFLLVFGVYFSAAEAEEEYDSEHPYFDFSVFQDSDKYESWLDGMKQVFKEKIDDVRQMDREDYALRFNGTEPVCDFETWRDYQLQYLDFKLSQVDGLEFNGNNEREKDFGKPSIPDCMNREIIDVDDRVEKDAQVNDLSINITLEDNEPIKLRDDSIKQSLAKKSFLRGFLNKISGLIWVQKQ